MGGGGRRRSRRGEGGGGKGTVGITGKEGEEGMVCFIKIKTTILKTSVNFKVYKKFIIVFQT